MKPGKIVILNGTSSSGKSSILKALQNLLEEPYLDAGLDKFIWMLPPRYLDRPLWDEVLGKASKAGYLGHQLVHAMHRSAAEIAYAGFNVLIDHVLVEKSWLADCGVVFKDLPAHLIAIRCPLKILEQRERQRRDRTLGQARAQFEKVHRYAVYDFEVDTSTHSVDDCARLIANYLSYGNQPKALNIINNSYF